MTWFKLALRNVFRQKKRSFLLAGAIAFGMLAITLLNTLTGAMGTAVKTNFSTALGGHVYIAGEVVSQRGYSNSQINQPEIVAQAIAQLSVPIREIKQRSASRVQFINGSSSANIQVQGIELSNEKLLFKRLRLVAGSLQQLSQSGTVALPVNKARDLNIKLGDKILAKAETMSGQQNLLEWEVVALFADQASFGRTSAYANLATVNQMLNIPTDNFQRVNLLLGNLDDMHKATEELNQALAKLASLKPEETDSTFGPWRRMMRGDRAYIEEPWSGTRFDITNLDDITANVMSMVEGLNLVAKLIFAIMLVITLVGISNSYRMVLLERVAEIGNMRAMGAQASSVFRLFIYEALILALLGIAVGLIVAIAGIFAIEAITFAANRGPVRMFTVAGHLPMIISISGIAISAGLIILMAMLAAYLPARGAALLDPAEALRSAT